MELIFDTETTGFYLFKKPPNDPAQPDIVQLGMVLAEGRHIISKVSIVVKPDLPISEGAMEAHGLSNEYVKEMGISRKVAGMLFCELAQKADLIVAHNIDFDMGLIATAMARERVIITGILEIPTFCTMKGTADIVQMTNKWGGNKWPKLEEAHQFFVKKPLIRGAHDALEDALFCHDIFNCAREQGYLDQLEKGAGT